MLNKNEILLPEDFSDYNRFPNSNPIIDRLHVNERFSIIIDHRNNTIYNHHNMKSMLTVPNLHIYRTYYFMCVCVCVCMCVCVCVCVCCCVLIEYVRSFQGHRLKSIPTDHVYSRKRMHPNASGIRSHISSAHEFIH